MATLDHWRPVAFDAELGRTPKRVRLDGRELAIFRTAGGDLGAFDDVCPHRRMSLAEGEVVGDRLRCAYHGWTFACDGSGESPGTPKLHAKVSTYDVLSKHGALWIRRKGSELPFPHFDVSDHYVVGTLRRTVQAPLEIVLDNFTEVEHTATTHALLGYELDRMSEVETKVDATADAVRVFNSGPQKRIQPIVELLFGVRTGDIFVDDWTTRFSPVHSCYDQYWTDAKTGKERGARWRIYVFFSPNDENSTELFVFAYIKKGTLPGGAGMLLLARRFLLGLVAREVDLDVALLAKLADKNPSIEGMKLSRFDRVLGLQRERIDRIFRGAVSEEERTSSPCPAPDPPS